MCNWSVVKCALSTVLLLILSQDTVYWYFGNYYIGPVCQQFLFHSRAPFDHISAMVWSGARGNITITAL